MKSIAIILFFSTFALADSLDDYIRSLDNNNSPYQGMRQLGSPESLNDYRPPTCQLVTVWNPDTMRYEAVRVCR